MLRRTLLTGAAAATLARPALAQPAAARVLRYVPQSDLTVLDPVFTTAYITRHHSMMVYDQLYGLDSTLKPQPQMVEGHVVEQGGLFWRFTLREGLLFHDGEPVRGRDCIASIRRWAQRDALGQALMARVAEMAAPEDRVFTIRLNKAFGPMLDTLAKVGPSALFVMPERIASVDANTQIRETIGSGPFRFKADERIVGARVVYERNASYRPREGGKAEWAAGPKQVFFDRVEWTVMPDPATAVAALQNGEVDWWENPITDLVPQLRRNRSIRVDIADPLGNIGTFRMNHTTTPFNDVKARRAVLMAMSQEDYMRALVGDDNNLWKSLPGYFTPGTPLYSEEGGEILKGPRNLDAAKRLLAESGYNGSPVTCVVAQDQPITKAQGDVTADLLKRIGFNVDFVATDWGTTGQRRAMKNPVGQGGWSMFHSWHAGADCINPAVYNAIRANGDGAWFGWPNIPAVETEVANWFDAPDLAAEKAVINRLNKAALDNVVFAPTGFFLGYQAWRANVSGIVKGPLPFFWGISKS
jgi:peptide/nickel transport system substrate-binding protein